MIFQKLLFLKSRFSIKNGCLSYVTKVYFAQTAPNIALQNGDFRTQKKDSERCVSWNPGTFYQTACGTLYRELPHFMSTPLKPSINPPHTAILPLFTDPWPMATMLVREFVVLFLQKKQKRHLFSRIANFFINRDVCFLH